jgi:hypothetical protein
MCGWKMTVGPIFFEEINREWSTILMHLLALAMRPPALFRRQITALLKKRTKPAFGEISPGFYFLASKPPNLNKTRTHA